MMTIDEMIAVLRASKEGKAIEGRAYYPPNGQWVARAPFPIWAFDMYEYRVKPESALTTGKEIIHLRRAR